MRLIQITCEALPELGGVAQYLHGYLQREREFGLQTEVVFVVKAAFASETILSESPLTIGVSIRGLQASIARRLGPDAGGVALLHYVGYSYHTTGAPFELIEQLEQLKRSSGLRVVSLFHEVHSSGRPWQRSFWYALAQRRASARLVALSDEIVCNTGHGQRALLAVSKQPQGNIHLVAIPSTIGESSVHKAWQSRANTCILFGKRPRKERLLQNAEPRIGRLLQFLGVSEIRDVGEPVDSSWHARMNGRVKIQTVAETSNEAISAEFGNARYFLIDTPTDLLGKSTVFSNGIAHACIPIWGNTSNSGWPGPEKFILDTDRLSDPSLLNRLPEISAACFSYYQAHRSWNAHMGIWQQVFSKYKDSTNGPGR